MEEIRQSMSIIVKLPVILQACADGHEAVEVEGSNVGECLKYLAGKYPELEKELFDTRGRLFGFYTIYVNGKSSYPQGPEKQVRTGDEITIDMALPGG
jgi:molybdopterin converting factor small subunit